MTDPRDMRAPSGFHERELRRRDLDPDPIAQFRTWLADAEGAGATLPNAMGLATADASGRPSARHVLLRGLDERGFTFYTNHDSRKGRQLAENPNAAIVFLWKELDRQVTSTGTVRTLSREESEAYFRGRPRTAQLGAWASHQSAVLPDRSLLEDRAREAERRFVDGDVPLPDFWGGFVLSPETIEFWQGRNDRLHDRFRYTSSASGWEIDRLSP
ncbi:MAG: pyridoxamine 5'-phosphate oxidase [Actinomycetota bacterium]